MTRARVLSAVSACWAALSIACAASPEEQVLLRFFEAARTLDTSIIAKYSTVGFNPRTDGIVQSFSVVERGPERDRKRDVTVEALVLDPAGRMVRRTYVVTFQDRVITGLKQVPASQTSREASSAPPN
jgi:hypothetical protein